MLLRAPPTGSLKMILDQPSFICSGARTSLECWDFWPSAPQNASASAGERGLSKNNWQGAVHRHLAGLYAKPAARRFGRGQGNGDEAASHRWNAISATVPKDQVVVSPRLSGRNQLGEQLSSRPRLIKHARVINQTGHLSIMRPKLQPLIVAQNTRNGVIRANEWALMVTSMVKPPSRRRRRGGSATARSVPGVQTPSSHVIAPLELIVTPHQPPGSPP